MSSSLVAELARRLDCSTGSLLLDAMCMGSMAVNHYVSSHEHYDIYIRSIPDYPGSGHSNEHDHSQTESWLRRSMEGRDAR